MAWDTEGTKRKIKDAATAEFTRHGPAGATIERIAKRAGVNKERVYNYFGSKDRLFSAVLRDEPDQGGRGRASRLRRGGGCGGLRRAPVRLPPATPRASSGCCAGRLSPSMTRCRRRSLRREHYQRKIAGMRSGQDSGALTRDVDPGALMLMIMSLTGWWSTAPQVARMLCGPLDEEEHDRRRAVVVEAARRLAAPRE